ncbi:M23 family metallopeptidase [Limisalsivibrio acetivorans]|uniref:M23 family metallopeptidase n=1 Tax=Limisalsivibrio acetivorans TaxID=1304888 RepID=UPI0006890966|nr:peptidoglycan DD-metalloendopeptidase family protein [Limisalsivibrio acetivorans]
MLNITAIADTYKVQWGDSLYSILESDFEPYEIIELNKEIKKKLPGFTLKTGTEIEKSENSWVIKMDLRREVLINKTTEGFSVDVQEYPVEVVNSYVHGEITSSLYNAMQEAGEDFSLAVKLASVYEWEIDFFKDIRKGDRFNILVEKRFIRDQFAGYGKILAADFINQGRLIRGIYYESEKVKGYYAPDGSSLKRGFLKAPLRFGRVSSGFSYKRLHPVHKVVKPHLGVDYAAPRGTPVYATADGYIERIGYDKYNGNHVGIRHMNDYHTLYLHFTRFAKGMGKGKYVRQGDVIGYVGSTGISTGPHVDYRIRKGRTYINPLRFKSPTKKLPESEMATFQGHREYYAYLLNSMFVRVAQRSKLIPMM